MRHRVPWVALLLAVALPGPAVGAVERTARERLPHDRLAAFREDLAVAADGSLRLAPSTRRLVPRTERGYQARPVLWTAVVSREEGLLVGTGHGGETLRVGPGEEATVLFTAGEPEVTAVLPGNDGSLFIASTPRGAIYRLLPDRRSELFGTIEARYLWALADDGAGRVLTATGDPATLVRLDDSGEARVIFRAEAESHLTGLLPRHDGRILVGSDGQGRVYQVSPSGQVEVLLDSPFREIASLALAGDGTLWAVAAAHRSLLPERPRVKVRVPRVSPDIAPGESGAPESRESRGTLWGEIEGLVPDADEREIARGALFRLPPGGVPVEEVWTSHEETPTAVVVDADGSVVVGTADPARLYRFGADGRPERLADLAEGAVTSLIRDHRGGLVVTTGQPGVIYRLLTVSAERGEFRSVPLDGGAGARWGLLSWYGEIPAGGRLDLSARTGDALPPGPGWSTWVPVSGVPGTAPLPVPPGRYLQVRARFGRGEDGMSPVLRGLEARYRPVNHAPVLTRVTWAPTPPEGETPPEGPGWTARWEGHDPDSDPLLVRLELAPGPEGPWEEVARGRLTSPLSLDPGDRSPGTYLLRLSVDDGPANLPGEGRRVSLTSEMVRYHPEPPTLGPLRLETTAGGEPRLSAAVDAGPDTLAGAWITVDGGATWWPAGAADGVLDGPRDTVVALLPPYGEGPVELLVRDGSGAQARASAPLR